MLSQANSVSVTSVIFMSGSTASARDRHQIAIAPGASTTNIALMRYVIAVLFAIAADPALAVDPAAVDLWGPLRGWPPAESGKPVIGPQPLTLSPNSLENCPSGMTCSLRLLGDI